MKITKLLILFSLCFLACKHKQVSPEKFDKAKWALKQGKSYPYRDKMLKDLLISTDTLHGLKRGVVVELLGQPNRSDSIYLFYLINQDLIANFFPLHTKTLVIKFAVDSTVIWTKIHE